MEFSLGVGVDRATAAPLGKGCMIDLRQFYLIDRHWERRKARKSQIGSGRWCDAM